jgi:hypothetical protein
MDFTQAASRFVWNVASTVASSVRELRNGLTEDSAESTDTYVPYREVTSACQSSGDYASPDPMSLSSTHKMAQAFLHKFPDAGHLSESDLADFEAHSGYGHASPGGVEEKTEDIEPPLIVPREPFPVGQRMPQLSEESALLRPDDCLALEATIPAIHRWRHWRLLYSTGRDGISLATLYRRVPPGFMRVDAP